MKLLNFVFLASLLTFSSCDDTSDSKTNKAYKLIESGESPFEFRAYELNNGLRVHLSNNPKKPRIQTYIGVKVGSKNDPAHATGLAHYLEHMMFKGTSKIAAIDWEKERVLLKQISDLYEKRSKITDKKQRELLYHEIDSLSYLASELVVANEYDKLISELGGKGTNAYTSMDQTVYLTDIPSSELEKWATIEAERFKELVLRIFHTELEAVYEEFNIGQDSDGDRMYEALLYELFPNHTYGTQSTIGKGEHLKNPSMVEIHKFFDQYYVPNNMVISLAGDLDYEKSMDIIAQTFGQLKSKPLTKKEMQSPDLKEEKHIELKGKENAELVMAYRFDGLRADDNVYIELIDRMLNNGYTGLLDLNLTNKQKVQEVYSYPWTNTDYSTLIVGAYPKENQSLDSLERLIKTQIKLLKAGAYDDWLPEACLNDILKENLESATTNSFLANEMLYAGIHSYKLSDFVKRYQNHKGIKKAEIQEFINKTFNSNLVVLKKEQGEAEVLKIDAPKITPVKLNRNVQSAFYTDLKAIPSQVLEAQFQDLKAEIENNQNPEFVYLKNSKNDLFTQSFVFEFGSYEAPQLALALDYVQLIGSQNTDKETFNKELFKYGGSWSIFVKENSINLKLSGLNQNYDKILGLVNQLFEQPKGDIKVFKELIQSKIKSRTDAEFDKSYLLWKGLLGNIKYEGKNPYVNTFSNQELKKIKENELINQIANLFEHPHQGFYFGPMEKADVLKLNPISAPKFETPKSEPLTENDLKKEAHILNYDMVQANVILTAKLGVLDQNQALFNKMFSQYYGNLAFRDIRESKALAYSTYISIDESNLKGHSNYLYAFVGCQVDKFPLSLSALQKLLSESPTDKDLFDEVKTQLIKDLKSKRLVDTDLYWAWKKRKRKGFDLNVDKQLLKELETYSFEQFKLTVEKQINTAETSLLILADKNQIDPINLADFESINTYEKHEILP